MSRPLATMALLLLVLPSSPGFAGGPVTSGIAVWDTGQPGPEGSAAKLLFARLNQEISALELDLLGEEGLRHDEWTMRRPTVVDFAGRTAGTGNPRAKGNSIEGGTSEILRNILGEQVLGLPGEPRVDKDLAWSAVPRN